MSCLLGVSRARSPGKPRLGSASARCAAATHAPSLDSVRAITRRFRVRLVATTGLSLVAIASAGCLGYAPEGTVATPPPPSSDGSTSRLPQLLSQLQGGGAGVEIFDGSQNEVLAAQDTQGKAADDTGTPAATATVAGASTPGPTSTPTPGSLPLEQPTSSPSATATAAPSTTPTATPTPSATPPPTAVPTPTPTPVPTTPPEGGSGGGLPPTEG